MLIEGLSDKGIARKNNQDSFIIDSKDGYTLAVVCDGIGGHKAGEIASQLACKIMKEEFASNFTNVSDWLALTCKVANRNVFLQGSNEDEKQGMGTTMVACVRSKDSTAIINVGDSRCYTLKGNIFTQQTIDHSLINELMNKGFSYEEACSHGKNVITRAIGIESNCDFDIYEIENDYDILMLCSDGLYNYVDEEKIIDVLKSHHSIKRKNEDLITLANQAGGYDNITVVLMEVTNNG